MTIGMKYRNMNKNRKSIRYGLISILRIVV